jgi:hypothetical protein
VAVDTPAESSVGASVPSSQRRHWHTAIKGANKGERGAVGVRPDMMLARTRKEPRTEDRAHGGRATGCRELFATCDRNDFATVQQMFGNNAQRVDEISRRWLRTSQEHR